MPAPSTDSSTPSSAGPAAYTTAFLPGAERGTCPTCAGPALQAPRYNRAICGRCTDSATCALPAHADAQVSLGGPNASTGGGAEPGHEIGGVWTLCDGGSGVSYRAWVVVRGVACSIQEARFGGTVAEPR